MKVFVALTVFIILVHSQANNCPQGQYWNGLSCSPFGACQDGYYFLNGQCLPRNNNNENNLGNFANNNFGSWGSNPFGNDGSGNNGFNNPSNGGFGGRFGNNNNFRVCPVGMIWNGTGCSRIGQNCINGCKWNGTICITNSLGNNRPSNFNSNSFPSFNNYNFYNQVCSQPCPSGYYYYYNVCVQNITDNCPPGWYYNGWTCVYGSIGGINSNSNWNYDPYEELTRLNCDTSLGLRWNGSACAFPSSVVTGGCVDGYVLINNQCQPDPCPIGFRWIGTMCVKGNTNDGECPRGYYLRGNICFDFNGCPIFMLWNGNSCVNR